MSSSSPPPSPVAATASAVACFCGPWPGVVYQPSGPMFPRAYLQRFAEDAAREAAEVDNGGAGVGAGGGGGRGSRRPRPGGGPHDSAGSAARGSSGAHNDDVDSDDDNDGSGAPRGSVYSRDRERLVRDLLECLLEPVPAAVIHALPRDTYVEASIAAAAAATLASGGAGGGGGVAGPAAASNGGGGAGNVAPAASSTSTLLRLRDRVDFRPFPGLRAYLARRHRGPLLREGGPGGVDVEAVLRLIEAGGVSGKAALATVDDPGHPLRVLSVDAAVCAVATASLAAGEALGVYPGILTPFDALDAWMTGLDEPARARVWSYDIEAPVAGFSFHGAGVRNVMCGINDYHGIDDERGPSVAKLPLRLGGIIPLVVFVTVRAVPARRELTLSYGHAWSRVFTTYHPAARDIFFANRRDNEPGIGEVYAIAYLPRAERTRSSLKLKAAGGADAVAAALRARAAKPVSRGGRKGGGGDSGGDGRLGTSHSTGGGRGAGDGGGVDGGDAGGDREVGTAGVGSMRGAASTCDVAAAGVSAGAASGVGGALTLAAHAGGGAASNVDAARADIDAVCELASAVAQGCVVCKPEDNTAVRSLIASVGDPVRAGAGAEVSACVATGSGTHALIAARAAAWTEAGRHVRLANSATAAAAAAAARRVAAATATRAARVARDAPPSAVAGASASSAGRSPYRGGGGGGDGGGWRVSAPRRHGVSPSGRAGGRAGEVAVAAATSSSGSATALSHELRVEDVLSESLLPAAALPPLPPSPSALLGDVAEALAGAESLLDAAAEAGGEGGGGAGGGASSTSLAARTDEAIAAVLVVAARAGILQSGGAAASASSAAGPGHDAGVAAVRHADSLAAVRAWVEAQSAIATAYADALDAREAAAAAAPALPGAAVRQSSGSRGPAVESAAVGAGVRQSAKGGGGRATSAGRRRGVSVELAAPAAARASDPQEASITRSRGAAAVQGVRENAPGAGADNVHQATRRPAKRTRETVAGSAATPAQSRPALAARPLSVSERIARVSDPALRELLTDGSLTRGQVATLLQSVEDA